MVAVAVVVLFLNAANEQAPQAGRPSAGQTWLELLGNSPKM
jgi:hypothetical protein